MKPRHIATVLLFAFLPTATVPLRAHAQDDATTTAARARFKEGVDFYDRGKYEEARLAFLQAYALKKHPAVLLNLAQSTLRAGHALEASKYFQQYLKEAQNVTPAQKKDAEQGLAESRQKIGRIEIVAPAGLEMTLDDKEKLGTTPLTEPVEVDPGPHMVKSPTEAVKVVAVAGQKVEAKFGVATSAPPAVVPVPAPTPAPVATDPGANPPPPPNNVIVGSDKAKRTDLLTPPDSMVPVYIGLAAAGVGLVTAIVFAAFKADAQSKADGVANDIRNAAQRDGRTSAAGICSSSDPSVQQRYGTACRTLADNNDKVDTNAAIANVSLVVMGVGLAVAAGWFFFGPKKGDDKAAVAPKPPTVTPYWGYGSGGLTLSGAF
jgi:hypothetical protein